MQGIERAATMDREFMQHLDRIHATLADGFAPPEALSGYLAFLDAIPRDVSFSAHVTVAMALVDNVLAIDELKLEHRRLRCPLDALESATYELLVRIGHRHAEIISHRHTAAPPQLASAVSAC
jgi:hypothetical protein